MGKRAPPLHNTTGPSYHVTLPERDRTDSASCPAPPGAEVLSIPAESAALSSPPPREDPGRWGEPRCPPPQIRGRRAAPIPLYLTPVGVSCTHSPQPPSLSIISLQARGADPPTSPAPFSSISSPSTSQKGGGCPHNPPHPPPRPIPTENRKRHNPPPPPPASSPFKGWEKQLFPNSLLKGAGDPAVGRGGGLGGRRVTTRGWVTRTIVLLKNDGGGKRGNGWEGGKREGGAPPRPPLQAASTVTVLCVFFF